VDEESQWQHRSTARKNFSFIFNPWLRFSGLLPFYHRNDFSDNQSRIRMKNKVTLLEPTLAWGRFHQSETQEKKTVNKKSPEHFSHFLRFRILKYFRRK